MASTFRLDAVNFPEILDGLTAIIFSPFIVPVAEVAKQPVVQSAVKVGIALSESYQGQVDNQLVKTNNKTTTTYVVDGRSKLGRELIRIISELNGEVLRSSNGFIDLRLVVPMGLGTLAIYQLLNQEQNWAKIPWYTLAWFAFDVFIKLNYTELEK